MSKTITWNDLADFYNKKTGAAARIEPMEKIYRWATEQPEITINPDTSLSFTIAKRQEEEGEEGK